MSEPDQSIGTPEVTCCLRGLGGALIVAGESDVTIYGPTGQALGTAQEVVIKITAHAITLTWGDRTAVIERGGTLDSLLKD